MIKLDSALLILLISTLINVITQPSYVAMGAFVTLCALIGFIELNKGIEEKKLEALQKQVDDLTDKMNGVLLGRGMR